MLVTVTDISGKYKANRSTVIYPGKYLSSEIFVLKRQHGNGTDRPRNFQEKTFDGFSEVISKPPTHH